MTTGWIIAGGILLFILILLGIPVVVHFDYGDALRLKVKYLCFTLYQLPAKPKKNKKPKKQKKFRKAEQGGGAEKSSAFENTASPTPVQEEKLLKNVSAAMDEHEKKQFKKTKNPDLFEILELVKVAVDSLSKPLKKLCRRIKIQNFSIEMICGGDDAAKAALNFGRMNLLITNALGWMGSFFNLKEPYIDINVDFQSEETIIGCSCKIKLSALAALAFVFTFLGRLIVRALRSERIKGWLGRMTAKPPQKKKKQTV